LSQWAKPKKLSWQRKRRRELAGAGLCLFHPLVAVLPNHKYCADCLKQKRDATNQKRFQLKLEAFAAYGHICSCCGEAHPELLTLEHTKGNGGAHRKSLGVKAGIWFYTWLKKHGFPQDLGLTVHCFNCNCSKGQYGYCPHEREGCY
jgi:hypothetical protein